jgi:hypothetical protein
VGTARWRGIIYDSFVPRRGGARIYRGIYGAASYQSVYRDRGHTLDLAHQVGVPVAAVAMPFGLLGLVSPGLAVPTVIALAFVAMLFGIDVVRSAPPRGVDDKLRYRFGVALLHLLQPLVRTWGRMRQAPAARRQLPPPADFPRPARRGRRGVLLFAETGLRADLAAGLVGAIRRGGVRALPSTGWDDYDAELLGSALVVGRLVTSSHPEGCVQVAVFRSPRWRRIAEAALLLAVLVFVSVPLAIVFGALVAIETGRGWWRTGPLVRRLLNGAEAAA